MTVKMMRHWTTKAHHLLNSVQQESEYELEAIELTTAEVRVLEGLEGGFISFDQHALMLSTIVRFIDVCEKRHFNHRLVSRYCEQLSIY
jgi:hypothetical protein